MVIFDWDGTLCDSTHHIVASVQTASREMGLPVPSDEAAANIIGLGLPEGMARLFPEVPEERRVELAQTYSRHYVANESDTPELFPGALETLHSAHGHSAIAHREPSQNRYFSVSSQWQRMPRSVRYLLRSISACRKPGIINSAMHRQHAC